MEWLTWLIDPLNYGIMWCALLASVMVGVICSVFGTYVILHWLAFFGDALAYAITLACVQL